MKKIDVSTPKHPDTFALVDDEDYDRINANKWSAVKFQRSNTLYAQRDFCGKKILMHREILGEHCGPETDHSDLDGLNNQQVNIRACTHSQNMQNRQLPKNNKSGYKGVFWCKRERKWRVTIGFNGKNITVGGYFCLIKAAKAYDEKAIELFGEFAYTNFRRPK